MSAVLFAGDTILPKHMPLKIQEVSEMIVELPSSLKDVSKQAKYKAEKELISKVLKDAHWNKSKASRILKVDYKTLHTKIKEYSIGRS